MVPIYTISYSRTGPQCLVCKYTCRVNHWHKFAASPFVIITHSSDVIMGAMASQITSLTSVSSTVYSGADRRKHQSSASLAFVRGIHRWPVNSPHKWPVTPKMFPSDDIIMDPKQCCVRNRPSLFGRQCVTWNLAPTEYKIIHMWYRYVLRRLYICSVKH